MNESMYNKISEVCELLVNKRTSPPFFQQRVERCINVSKPNGYAQCPTSHIIKLKNPENRNDIQRGLKVCCSNAFNNEYVIKGGELIFKFNPLISMIKYQDEYCAECCEQLCKEDKIICCAHCQLRKFCSESCKIKALTNWHEIECEFMKYLEGELILKPENNNLNFEPTEIDIGFVDNLISILLLAFRLLIKLSIGDSCQLELILNLSDHIELFDDWLNKKPVSNEHDELFELTRDKIGKLMIEYFEDKKLNFNKKLEKQKFKDINKYGIYRLIFLIFINCTTKQDSYGDNIGLMFDPLFSMINHNCEPNATVIWGSNNEVLIKSLNDINCTDEITINYSSSTIPIEMRQMSLMKSNFFICECRLCSYELDKGDPTLPVDCNNCGYHVSGFRLCKFNEFETNIEKLSPSKKVSFSKQCQNCESEVEISKVFIMYKTLMIHIKYITKVDNLELLFNWIGETETLSIMTQDTMSETVSLFKQAIGVIPVRSWPMLKLIGLLRVFQKEVNGGTLNLIRLTLIGVFIGESSLGKRMELKPREGGLYHEVCVTAMSYLANEYKSNREAMNIDLFVLISKSVVFMSMIGYEIMIKKYSNGTENGVKQKVPIMEEIKMLGRDANQLIKRVKPEAFIRETSNYEMISTISEFAEHMSIGMKVHFSPIEVTNARDFGIKITGNACAIKWKRNYSSRKRCEWMNELI